MASGSTTTYLIPYPLSTDAVNVHGDMTLLANRLEELFTVTPVLTITNTFLQPQNFTTSINSGSSTFGLFNSPAILNIGLGASTISIGASSGTLTINNPGVVLNSTSYLKLPVGLTNDRPGTASIGMVRYNTTLSAFEGYVGNAWTSLGGVKSVDALTYIIAETSPGASNDELEFYAALTGSSTSKVGGWNQTRLTVLNTTDSTAYTDGALIVAGGVGIAKKLFVNGATTFNNASIAFNGASTSFTTSQTTGTISLFNSTFGGTLLIANNASTTTIAGSSTTFNLGSTGTASSTTNIVTGAVGSGATKTINLGTGSNLNGTTNITIGAGNTQNFGTTYLNSPVLTVQYATTLNFNGNNSNFSFATTSTGILTFFNTSLTTVNAFGSATTISEGGSATSITFGSSTAALTHNYSTGATISGSTKTLNIGTGGVSGSTTAINIGSSNNGTTTVNGTLVASPINATSTSGTASLFGNVTSGGINIATNTTGPINIATSATGAINIGGSSTTTTTIQGNVTVTGSITSGAQTIDNEITPIDDIYTFDGLQTRFLPTYQGIKLNVQNPLRLLITINGIIQRVDFPEYVWQAPLPRNGFQVDNDGYLVFSEPVPAGSDFDGRLMSGPITTTKARRYPFKAMDILIGG